MQVLRPSPCVDFTAIHYLPDYGDMASLPIRSYNEVSDPRSRGLSPNSSTSSPSTGLSTSLGRSSKAASRSPPVRQRTPIRHHRQSISRVQSSSRPEALLAYATRQDSQASTPQSMASSQGAFPPSAYMMPPVTSTYQVPSGYNLSAGMSQQQQGGQYMQVPSSYNVESNPSTYFGLGRSVSFPLENLPSIQPPESLYPPNLGSNGNSNSWSSSSAAPHIPSMSLPSSSSFSPSPAPSMDPAEGIRVLASRPKPQCFDHGCNGRQFSTFSNLLRHQREKSGSATKAVCPHCGTEFTRTTARNGHLYGGKCKGIDGQGNQEPAA
jgi:hypothetical protein